MTTAALASLVQVLKVALALLISVQANPHATPQMTAQAQLVAQQAIAQAMTILAEPVATPSIAPSSSGGGILSIDDFSGPATLAPGQEGVWTITAHSSQNRPLSYTVLWGDEPQNAATASVAFNGRATISHTYVRGGSYSVQLRVMGGASVVDAKLPLQVGPQNSCTTSTTCAYGTHAVQSGTDVAGCALMQCVADSAVCVSYVPISCPAGQYARSSGVSSNSCPLPPRCVADVPPSISLPNSGFYSASSRPFITGTASSEGVIAVVITSDQGVTVSDSGLFIVKAGQQWSTQPDTALPLGTFTVSVRSSTGVELATQHIYRIGQ